MGTRSRIAVQLPDGLFQSVYCHWDGYPSWNGRLLQEHYNSFARAKRLISMGGISSLGKRIGRKHDFEGKAPAGTTTFYARDRGEDLEVDTSRTLKALSKLTQDTGGEWLYVYRDDAWWCGEGGIAFFGMPASKSPGSLKLLADVLAMKEHAS